MWCARRSLTIEGGAANAFHCEISDEAQKNALAAPHLPALLLGDSVAPLRIACIGLILSGAVGLRLFLGNQRLQVTGDAPRKFEYACWVNDMSTSNSQSLYFTIEYDTNFDLIINCPVAPEFDFNIGLGQYFKIIW